MEETYLVRTEKLVKSYRGRTVVNEVDVNVRPGEIVGLLGPNGAGKTTTFYMVTGLIRPTAGQVWFKECWFSTDFRRIHCYLQRR